MAGISKIKNDLIIVDDKNEAAIFKTPLNFHGFSFVAVCMPSTFSDYYSRLTVMYTVGNWLPIHICKLVV